MGSIALASENSERLQKLSTVPHAHAGTFEEELHLLRLGHLDARHVGVGAQVHVGAARDEQPRQLDVVVLDRVVQGPEKEVQ